MSDNRQPDNQNDWRNMFRRLGNNGGGGPRRFRFSLWYFLLVIVALSALNMFMNRDTSEMIEYSDFRQKIIDGEIVRVRMTDGVFTGYTMTGDQIQQQFLDALGRRGGADDAVVYRTVPVRQDYELVTLMEEQGVEYFAEQQRNNYLLEILLTWIIPFAFLIIIWRFLIRRMGNLGGGNVMSFGQNNSKIVAENNLTTRFGDVAGCDESKDELVEVVDFLRSSEKYTKIGGKIPKGILLVGPPGTGKTLLARAVAGEAGVTFFRMSGAEFVEMFVGVGAARVRDLFKQARQKSPCIIFIDELDAIGKSRAAALSTNDEREQTLNQLLVEMDGFDSTSGVIILAATNRPEILDPALLRPGRFDRQVLVDKPDLLGREEILKIHAVNVQLDESVDLKDVAKATPGFVGADLANIINEAAILAVRAGRRKVKMPDFMEAIEKTIAGLEKKNRLINPREREIVAYHETGHALVAAFTPDADPVQKISIVPRGLGALGYTMQTPTEDRFLMTKEELLGRIDVLLGGRAAEKIIYDKISTGASNDIMRATDIARSMITEYGMSDRFRNVALTRRNQRFLDGGQSIREYSEDTQLYVDEEIARIVEERYARVLELLTRHAGLLSGISRRLLEEEIISEEDFMTILEEDEEGAAELARRRESDMKTSDHALETGEKRNKQILTRQEERRQREAEARRKAEEEQRRREELEKAAREAAAAGGRPALEERDDQTS